MFKRVVLWKLKDEVDGLDKAALAKEAKRRLDALPAIIPEIDSYEVGINTSHYDGVSFFDMSIIATYQDRKAFKRYCTYPEQNAVVAYIHSIMIAQEIVDYEV